nr:MAG TPA: hypothetical protein [Caudoviricetes sp.]
MHRKPSSARYITLFPFHSIRKFITTLTATVNFN